MAEDKEIKQEVTIVDENDVPPFVRAKIQKELHHQELMNQTAQAEYERALSEGNVDKAIELLTDLIFLDDNTPERRQKLRELYSSQCQSGDAVEYGYLKVIEVRGGATGNPINNAKTDYIEYLKIQAQQYDYGKYVDERAIMLARKIAELLLEELEDNNKATTPKKSKKSSQATASSEPGYKIYELDFGKKKPKNNYTKSDTEIIQWLIRGQEYERAWSHLQTFIFPPDLVQLTLKTFQIECTRFQNNGESEKIEYQQATWYSANLYRLMGNTRQAIQKYVECKNYQDSYQSAYALVDLHDISLIQFTLELFKQNNNVAYTDILTTILKKHDVVESMFKIKPMPSNMALKYGFLQTFYCISRVKTLFGVGVAFLYVFLLLFGIPVLFLLGLEVKPDQLFTILFGGLPILILINDIVRYNNFTETHIFYNYLKSKFEHPQLFSIGGTFTKTVSEERSAVKHLIIVAVYFFVLLIMMFGMANDKSKNSSAVNSKSTPTIEQSINSENSVQQSPIPVSTDHENTLGENWIKDDHTEIYLWNLEPKGDEHISWNGGFVQDGDYKFADGSGTLTWYREGEVIQVDEGTFEHGRHHGRFKHTFKSGNVAYSNWEHGEEIQDTNDNQSSDSRGQFVGTYNSGMKAYIVPGSFKISSDRKSCNVKIVAEGNVGDIAYLDYHIWREGSTLKFSNSEGYSGVVTSDMRVENKIWEIAQSLNR